METKMTPELQEAYNEWLLLWGYREVSTKAAQITRPYLFSKVGSNIMGQYVHRLNNFPHIYQLKTIEELNNESLDEDDTKTARSL